MKAHSVNRKVKNVAKRWNQQYATTTNPKHQEIGRRLTELDPNTATAELVNTIIGNESWTSLIQCEECYGYYTIVVELGSGFEGDTNFGICRTCLSEAMTVFADEYQKVVS